MAGSSSDRVCFTRVPINDHDMAFNLYPPPKRFRQHSSRLPLEGRRWIQLEAGMSRRLQSAAARLGDETARPLAITFGSSSPDETLVTVHCRRKGGNPQAYRMQCDGNGLRIEAAGEPGLFYGLATLKQILEQCGDELPYFRIEDEPDFAERGVMLDISRCKVPTLDTLRQLIDRLADLKYNQLQLYTEHTFAFVNHPTVWADASPMTAADIVDLNRWCEDRFIDLVPNQNSVGHFERWLRHPAYHRFAECPDGFTHPLSGTVIDHGSTLKPSRDSLRLLRELYDELLPLFTSGYFNIGGDEPWELGQGWSRKRCQARGTTAVYVEFLTEIQKLVARRDRRMMFWSDIALKDPNSLKRLPRDLVALNWGYEASHPFKKESKIMAGAGLPWYVCPGTSAWNSLTGRTTNMLGNLDKAARNGLEYGARGLLVTDWGDHGHHQYLPISYPGFVMGACHAWNHRASRRLDPADGVDRLFFQANGGTGEILTALGRIPDLVTTDIRNATLFNRLLFWPMKHEPAAAAQTTAAELGHCLDELAALRRGIPAPGGGERDQGPVRAELENAIDMAVHGIHRLQYFRGGAGNPDQLRTALLTIIGRHESLWLARNRPGGLRESIGHLEGGLAGL